MTQVLICSHKWSTWTPIEMDEKGQPIFSLSRGYVEGDMAWRTCSWCNTWHVNKDPEPRVILGRIEND